MRAGQLLLVLLVLAAGCETVDKHPLSLPAEAQRATLLHEAYGDEALRLIASRIPEDRQSSVAGGFFDRLHRGDIQHAGGARYVSVDDDAEPRFAASGGSYDLYWLNDVWVDDEGAFSVRFDAVTWVTPAPSKVVTDGQFGVNGSMHCLERDQTVTAVYPENTAAYTFTYAIDPMCGPAEAYQTVIHSAHVELEDQEWMTHISHESVPFSGSGGGGDFVDF